MPDTMFHHISVLPQETLQNLLPDEALQNLIQTEKRSLNVVDCTLGGGGHALALLSHLPKQLPVNFFGIDRDPTALKAAELRLRSSLSQDYPERTLHFLHAPFSQGLSSIGAPIDIILADLGVSSPQLDDAGRGFSILRDGPLDMRMGIGCTETARDILENWEEHALARIFKEYGEEPKARSFAQRLVQDRSAGTLPLNSSVGFAEYTAQALRYHGSRTHPATRIFQALRIAVNDELGELTRVLEQLHSQMGPFARVGFITFHSLEDRLVKYAMRAWEKGRLPNDAREDSDDGVLFGLPPQTISWGREIPRGGVAAASAETAENPRARSARLRCFVFSDIPAADRLGTAAPTSRKRR